jgi:hypothetical protein
VCTILPLLSQNPTLINCGNKILLVQHITKGIPPPPHALRSAYTFLVYIYIYRCYNSKYLYKSKSDVAVFAFSIISYRARATRTYEKLILQKMDILMSDEVRYFRPDNNKYSSLRLAHILKITITQL